MDMINSVSHFHFFRPLWLLALIPIIILLILLQLKHQQKNNWQKVCDAHLLPHLLVNKQQNRSKWPYFLALLAWFFAIVALAGPTWSRLPQPAYRNLTAKVIVLDLSQSMLINDIAPTRLSRAKYKIIDLLNQLKDSSVGMVVFTGEPFVVSPLTQDVNTIKLFMPSLLPKIMPVMGQNVAKALTKAASLLKDAGDQKGEIILLTDAKVNATDLNVAKEVAKQGYQISVLGIGTQQNKPLKKADGNYLTDEQGSIIIPKLDITGLKQLAKAGGGRYVTFTDNDHDIKALLSEDFTKQLKTKSLLTKVTSQTWRDQGHWFVLIVLALVLIAFRRGFLAEVLR